MSIDEKFNSILNYRPASLKGKHCLITGASAGIGRATAILLASEGANLYLVARREERLQEIKDFCSKKFPESSVNFVIGDLNDPQVLKQMEEKNFFNVDVLINNAGLALGNSDIQNYDESHWETMLQTNCLSVFKITKKVLPFMEKNGGDIVSLSSIAAHEGYARGSVYCASKAALRSFMTSLRKETHGGKVRVMMLSPGMVKTEFSLVRFEGDKQKADQLYDSMRYLTEEDMAHSILFMLTRPKNVNINDLIALSIDQSSATQVKRS